jgi:apolipoprotein N-acyltransferase
VIRAHIRCWRSDARRQVAGVSQTHACWRQPDIFAYVEVDDDNAMADTVLVTIQAIPGARELDRPVLVNVDARRPDGRISKTMVVVRPDGLGETYTKQRLVPFGEYIPLRSFLGWVERFTEAAEEDRVPGTGLTTLRLGSATVGPLISYESTFPDMRRRHARAGVDMTLVQAAATTFQGTWALPQQASFEAVRAVESGRPAVLVAVSGTSAAFDARGRRLAWVDQHETGAWTVSVPLSQEETRFVRWGDWVPAACLVVVVAAALVAWVPVRRVRQHRVPSRLGGQGAR